MVSDLMRQFKEKQEEYDKNIRVARQISRNTINRLIVLSAGIVGFSVSFFSVPFLQSSLDINLLRISWYIFLAVIITGALILFLSGRIRYGKTWKVHQLSEWVGSFNEYSKRENFFANMIVLVTLINPANLIFNKTCENESKSLFQRRVNGLVVHKLARMEHGLVSFLENLFLILFILGLIFLVNSFKI